MTKGQSAAKLKSMGLIYKIENRANGKVYIGQTLQSLKQRKAEHLARLRANKRQHKLYQALRKYGEDNFVFTEIAYVLNDDDLDAVEIAMIKQYNSFNHGYNATAGGNSLSQEVKDRLSKMFKGRKMTWAHKGVATRRKNGTMPKKGHGGYGKDHAASKSYVVLTPNGEEVVFKGLRQFSRDNGLSHNLLLATLSGRQTHHKGYVLLRKFND